MADAKEGFVFYRSYLEVAQALPEDRRWPFIEKIAEYAFDRVEPEFDGLENMVFIVIRKTIDNGQRRYAANVGNGKKGGAPKGNKNASKQDCCYVNEKQPKNNLKGVKKTTQKQPYSNGNSDCNITETVTDTDTVTVTVNSVSDGARLNAAPPPRKYDENGRELDANGWRKVIR